jgi:hypothetical protein
MLIAMSTETFQILALAGIVLILLLLLFTHVRR